MEYEDEPWLPFKFDKVDDPYESETDYDDSNSNKVQEEDEDSKVEESENDEISDTNMDEPEEGEIRNKDSSSARIETATPATPAANSDNEPLVLENRGQLPSLPEETALIEPRQSSNTLKEVTQSKPNDDLMKIVDTNSESKQLDTENIAKVDPIRPNNNLDGRVLNGCFGTFPTTIPNFNSPTPSLQRQSPNTGRSSLKRKRNSSFT